MSTMSRIVYQEPIDAFLKDRRIQIATATVATVGVVIASIAVGIVAPYSWARVVLALIGATALFIASASRFIRVRSRPRSFGRADTGPSGTDQSLWYWVRAPRFPSPLLSSAERPSKKFGLSLIDQE